MNAHPRIRKIIKWTGAAMFVLLAVLWISTKWWCFAWMSRAGDFLHLTGGRIRIGSDGGEWFMQYEPGVHVGLATGGFEWWFQWHSGGPAWAAFVPLWAPLALTLAVAALAWRFDTLARRARLNLCPKCTYDRSGIPPGAPCPECGSTSP